jgi:hypothetical protein
MKENILKIGIKRFNENVDVLVTWETFAKSIQHCEIKYSQTSLGTEPIASFKFVWVHNMPVRIKTFGF